MTNKEALQRAEKLIAVVRKQWSTGKLSNEIRELMASATKLVGLCRERCARNPAGPAHPDAENSFASLEDMAMRINAMLFVLFPEPLNPWIVHIYIEQPQLSLKEIGNLIVQLQKPLYDRSLLAQVNAATDTDDVVLGRNCLVLRLKVSAPKDAWPLIHDQLNRFKLLNCAAVAFQLQGGVGDGGFYLLHWPPGKPPRPFEESQVRAESQRDGDGGKTQPPLFIV